MPPEHAVQQINRSIELVRYRDFSGELLALRKDQLSVPLPQAVLIGTDNDLNTGT